MFSSFSILSFVCSLLAIALTLPPDPKTTGLLEASHKPIIRPSFNDRVHPTMPSNHPDLQGNASVPDSTSANNSTNLGYSPACYEPNRWRIPITDAFDCEIAAFSILNDDPKDEPIHWSQRHTWSIDSCNFVLRPLCRRPQGVFSRTGIANAAWRLSEKCVTEEYGFRGGYIPIGAGEQICFEVEVFGRHH